MPNARHIGGRCFAVCDPVLHFRASTAIGREPLNRAIPRMPHKNEVSAMPCVDIAAGASGSGGFAETQCTKPPAASASLLGSAACATRGVLPRSRARRRLSRAGDSELTGVAVICRMEARLMLSRAPPIGNAGPRRARASFPNLPGMDRASRLGGELWLRPTLQHLHDAHAATAAG
jgi:hypothetical protein